MTRPVADPLVEACRLGTWPFLSWCFATRALVSYLELLAGKARGIHFMTWARLHPDGSERAQAAARELGWCPEYVTRVVVRSTVPSSSLPPACRRLVEPTLVGDGRRRGFRTALGERGCRDRARRRVDARDPAA
jgi:hypothetical protein